MHSEIMLQILLVQIPNRYIFQIIVRQALKIQHHRDTSRNLRIQQISIFLQEKRAHSFKGLSTLVHILHTLRSALAFFKTIPKVLLASTKRPCFGLCLVSMRKCEFRYASFFSVCELSFKIAKKNLNLFTQPISSYLV